MSLKTEDLVRIQVEELLGAHSYEIDLSRLTILHGYNGSGKTTLLKIIHLLLQNEYDEVLKCKFKSMSFHFLDGRKLTFNNEKGKDLICTIISQNNKIISKGSLSEQDFSRLETWRERFPTPKDFKSFLLSFEYMDSLQKDGEFPFVDRRNGQIIEDIDEALDFFRDIKFAGFKKEIEEYIKALKSFFIQTNRLETISSIMGIKAETIDSKKIVRHRLSRNRYRRDNIPSNPLKYIQSDLKLRIEDVAENSAQISREFDSEFFNLLLEELRGESITKDDERLKALEKELESIDKQENELIQLGLYEGPATETKRARIILEEEDAIASSLLSALTVFSKGLKRKFEIFKELKPKVKKFAEFLNTHLIGKTLKVSRKGGLQFLIHDKTIIEPWKLSSGEQHIVLLAYFFVFLAPKESIILIDEPEISLHVKWQENFIEDILKLSSETQLRFVLATHSPTIISHYREHMVRLESPVSNDRK